MNLLDKASIILTASAYNNGEALCVKPSDGSGDFDFSRATEGTRINAQGLVEVVANNLPRINYEGGCGHYLWEPQSTNLLPYSELFSNSAWAKTRCTIDAGGHISPSGQSNAFKMTATANDARLQDGNFASGVIYTQSIYVKSATGSNVSGQVDFSGTQIVTFTATDQWQRVTTTSDNTRVGTVRVRITNSGDELFVWGAQLERPNGLGTFDGSYATSYIPTENDPSGVTRNQDICTNGGTGTGLINSTEGVLYAEISALADDGTFRAISLSNGTATNRVSIRYNSTSNSISAFVYQGTTTVLSYNYIVSNIKDFHKVAIKYKSGDVSFWVDGVEIDTSTTSFSFLTLTNLSFIRGSNDRNFYGKTKSVAVWKEALSDSELQSLTTI